MSCCCEPDSPYHKHLAVLSGVLLAIGLLLSFQYGGEGGGALYEQVPDLPGIVLLIAAAVGGANFLPSGLRSLRSFSLDMDFLMSAAMIAAAAIGEFEEAAAIGFLFSLAELAEDFAVDRSRSALDALMSLGPESAEVVTTGGRQKVPVEDLSVGDVVAIRPGSRVPVDGAVVSGATTIDEAAITGESVPASKTVGDSVYAGTMNQDGYVEVAAKKAAEDTLLGRIVQMVEDAEDRKAPSEQFVRTFARFYTPIVVLLALGTILIPPLLLGESFTTWFSRGLALLVIACPCALIISTPVAVISAITGATRNGVLIKGGDHLEALAEIKAIAFDKTGTLTHGRFEVIEVVSANGASEDAILSVAGALEERSQHPIARSIVRQTEGRTLPSVDGFESIVGKGVRGSIDGIVHCVGQPEVLEPPFREQAQRLTEGRVSTTVVVASESKVLGAIVLADALREDAISSLASLKLELDVNITMLTGDRKETADQIGKAVGVDTVQSGLMPDQKLQAIEEMGRLYGSVAMVGDGVNDAPALAASRVGVAMGVAGSDAALETADAALLSDDLSKIPYLFRLSRASRRVIRQNIAISIFVKAVLAIGAATGFVSLAVAIVVGDIGMSLAVTGNALRLARCK